MTMQQNYKHTKTSASVTNHLSITRREYLQLESKFLATLRHSVRVEV